MKVEINKEACIGCGACQMIAPEVFEINDDGVSTVLTEEIEKDLEEKVNEAVDSCPTSAIKVEKNEQED